MASPDLAPQVSDAASTTAPPGSAIHDLGYRRYDGPRVGTNGAFSALYAQGVRAMFGVGRPLKTKVVPVLVMLVSMLPALALLTASSASNGQVTVRYGQVIGPQLFLFVVFLAAQAPEVLSRDQRHGLLPLLFTRDVTRTSYALARWTAVFTAMFIVSLGPLLLLYVGEIGIAADPAASFRRMGTRIFPVLGQSTLSAFAMTGIGTLLAALTSRRAYATAAIFGTFLLLAAVSTGLDGLAGVAVRSAELLDPLRAMRTMALLFFGETNRGMELNAPPPLWVYIVLCVAWGVAGAGLMLWRIRRIRA